MKTKALSLVLALAMCLGLTAPVLADGAPHTYQNGRYSVSNVLKEASGSDVFHSEDDDAWPRLTCAAPVKISIAADYSLVEYGERADYMDGKRTSLDGKEKEFTLTQPGFYYIDFFWAEDELYDQCQVEVTASSNPQPTAPPVETIPSSGTAYASTQTVQVNGKAVDMTAITLLDDAGGGYNYFKLRDLGAALGFNVGWSKEAGVFIESDKPYAG